MIAHELVEGRLMVAVVSGSGGDHRIETIGVQTFREFGAVERCDVFTPIADAVAISPVWPSVVPHATRLMRIEHCCT